MPALERSRGPERADGVSGWRLRGTWPRCRWRVGREKLGPGRSAWWCGGRRGWRLPAHRAANPGVKRGGDERVAQRVGPHALGYPCPSGDTPDDTTGRVSIDPLAVGSNEDRSLAAFPDHQIDGAGRAGRHRYGHDLATLAQDRERAVPALQAEVLDVDADGFGHPQAVERQQADQGVIPGAC